MSPADALVLAILGVATLRGLWIGLVRESFSLGSLVAAFLAVRFLAAPAAERLQALAGDALGPVSALVLAGAGLALGALVLGALVGRALRRGARAVGLAWLDRLGGGVLGCAEGALVGALILALAMWLLGAGHPLVAGSRAAAALERAQQLARPAPATTPPVAAPPRQR